MAFVSGKGGTGKSTTSVFVGGALALLGKKVLLVELDCGLRSVDIIAGISGQTVYDIEDVLEGRCEVEKAIVESPLYPGLSVISAPYGRKEIPLGGLAAMCNGLRNRYNYILLDTAAGLGTAYEAAVEIAHRLYFVLTPDPVALRDGRLISDSLADWPGQMRLIINRVHARVLEDNAIGDLDDAIDTVGVQLLGVVPDSPAIMKAGASGVPLPKSGRDAAIYTAIARRITGEDVPLVFQ